MLPCRRLSAQDALVVGAGPLLQRAPRCSSPLLTWGRGQCQTGSMALNGPSAWQALAHCTAWCGHVGARLWSRRTEAGLVQVTCRLSPSQMRGEKVSPPCAEAAPLPSALPSGWDSQVSTGCSHRAREASSHGEYGTALSAEWWEGGIGLEKTKYPTYIYPKELKNLMRSAFPAGVCNYPDPGHSKVVHVTLEDLHLLDHPEAGGAQPCLQ
ncbi:unnamed protein product [Caretta caretta]